MVVIPAPTISAKLAAGAGHTCLLTKEGDIKCWGHDAFGQLGDVVDVSVSVSGTPVEVKGLAQDNLNLAAGAYHTCAVTGAGRVKCWGKNEHGQLGDGTQKDSSTPVDVIGLAQEVKAVAAGAEHTCALTAGGAILCWGQNNAGQLGNGRSQDSLTPVQVDGLTSGVSALAAGVEFNCALMSDGRVMCWGSGSAGQLGDDSLVNHNTPVEVSGLDGEVRAIAAGWYHACALMSAGNVKCWGAGDGSDPNSARPVEVSGLADGVEAITAGAGHSCALTSAGGVKCWGDNYFDQLGNGTFLSSGSAINGELVDVPGLVKGVVEIVAGENHTCALLSEGGVKCWGDGSSGQLGDGTIRWRISTGFEGRRALEDVQRQVAFGPRLPDSRAHAQTIDYIQGILKENGWTTEIQKGSLLGHPIQNVVGRRGEGKPWIIMGAHYDSRLIANRDPDPNKRNDPVPGANDGASGVAVLLELARVLPTDISGQVWLVFFDLEDNGQIPGWDWILGSQAFVQALNGQPDAVVVLDMIGDADLNIYQEKNSDAGLSQEIWDIAHSLGYIHEFISQPKYSILDDHLPFLRAGIPAVDLIDFDYPYWHTTADTPDKVSASSLQAVGDTMVTFLTQRNRKQ